MNSEEARLRLELKSLLATLKGFHDECLKFPERKPELRNKQKAESYVMSRSYIHAKENLLYSDAEVEKMISEIDEIARFFND